MNTESQISKQAPSNAMEDRHRPSDLVSPRPNHPSSHAHTQFPMGYQMSSPYCQPDPQRIRENAMYMRDCQYSHMGMPSHGAFSNCWAHPCSCHHGHPDMAPYNMNYYMPPPFPHNQYGCCASPSGDKVVCNKMPYHPGAYQRKPHNPTPYRPRRRKQVTFQKSTEDTSHSQQQQHTMPSNLAFSPVSNDPANPIAASPAGEASSLLPPDCKVFNIPVEVTPSSCHMLVPDGLTLSKEHIEIIQKVASTGEPVYLSNLPGSDDAVPSSQSPSQDKQIAADAAAKAEMQLSLMAGDAGQVCFEGNPREATRLEPVQQESGVQYSSHPVDGSSACEEQDPDTIVFQKSTVLYYPSSDTIRKLPQDSQEYIQLSSSNLNFCNQASMEMPEDVSSENTHLTDEQQHHYQNMGALSLAEVEKEESARLAQASESDGRIEGIQSESESLQSETSQRIVNRDLQIMEPPIAEERARPGFDTSNTFVCDNQKDMLVSVSNDRMAHAE